MAEILARVLSSAIKVVPQTATTPGTTVFTVTGGPIKILALLIEITTVIGATACTMQWASVDAVSSTTQTISLASADTQSKAAGIQITLDPVSLATAPVISAAGGSSMQNPAANNAQLGGIIVMPGTVGLITNGSPTGNIKYHLLYEPMGQHSQVVMA